MTADTPDLSPESVERLALNLFAAPLTHCSAAAATLRALSAELTSAREALEAAEAERDAAIEALSEAAAARGRAEGRLAASEMAGVVEGWKRRAEAAEAALTDATEALTAVKDAEWNAAIEAAVKSRDDQIKGLRALLRSGCDLLAHEAEVLRISVTTSDGLSTDPEDAQNVAALNEIEEYIASVKATLYPARSDAQKGKP